MFYFTCNHGLTLVKVYWLIKCWKKGLLILQGAAITTPTLPVTSCHMVTLPSFALLASSIPANPSSPTFAGWLSSSDMPPGGVTTLTTNLEQLSGNYTLSLEDHSYADNTPPETQVTMVTCNSKWIYCLFHSVWCSTTTVFVWGCLGGITVRASDLRSGGHGFNS